MKRDLWLGALLVSAVSILMACGGQPSPATTTAPTSAPAVVATSAPVALPTTPAAVASVSPLATPAPELASPLATPGGADVTPAVGAAAGPTGTVNADLPAFKLGALTSYLAQIEIRDEAANPGPNVTPVPPVTMTMQYDGNSQQPVYAWAMMGQDAGQSGSQTARMLMAGSDFYVFVPQQGKWAKMPSNSPQNLPLKEDIIDPNKLAQVGRLECLAKKTS